MNTKQVQGQDILNQVLGKLEKAIDKSIQSGVKFMDIPRKSIDEFLEKNGIDGKDLKEKFYQDLKKIYVKPETNALTDKSPLIQRDLVQKVPQKKVFSEIKKITH